MFRSKASWLAVRVLRAATLESLTQGATLSIRSKIPTPLHLVLRSEWREDGFVELRQVCPENDEHEHIMDAGLVISRESDKKTSIGRIESHVSIVVQPSSNADPNNQRNEVIDKHDKRDKHEEQLPQGCSMIVNIPEKINLDCRLDHGGSISIPNKVEGDCYLSTVDGDIRVKKLRGHNIDLHAFGHDNIIYASHLLEAEQLQVNTSGRFRTKQVHGTKVEVHVQPQQQACSDVVTDEDDDGSLIDISSMYISGHGAASLDVSTCVPRRRAVRIKSHHGPLKVHVSGTAQPSETNQFTGETYPLVELGGVNGTIEADIRNSNPIDGNEGEWASCLAHFDSLPPETVSLVSADIGNIQLTVDRKVESDIRLLSTRRTDPTPSEACALLADEEDSHSAIQHIQQCLRSDENRTFQHISIGTDTFTSRGLSHEAKTDEFEYIDGWIENKSHEPDSRFDRKIKGDVGSTGKIRIDDAAKQALHGFSDRGRTGNQDEQTLRPLITVVGRQKITLETVSWLGAIARRYGLNEEGRDLGRQATRRGRPILPQ